MPDGKHCPECGKDIGLWPIFKAGLPNLIYCPHCDARLAYAHLGREYLVIGILVLLVTAISLGVGVIAQELSGWRPAWMGGFIVTMFGLWLPIEWRFAHHLRLNRILEVRRKAQPENRDYGSDR